MRNWNGLGFVFAACLVFWVLVALAVMKVVGG
nr:MAG TPA: hypothetical protein [Caudoviricetes sp.]